MDPGSRQVIYAALIGNVLVAAAKFAAAAFTHSAAMLSEAVHSLHVQFMADKYKRDF